MSGTKLELKTGGLYEVSQHDDFNGVMTYINGTEVSYDLFGTVALVWDKFTEVTAEEAV
jgi:hypothetical protein